MGTVYGGLQFATCDLRSATCNLQPAFSRQPPAASCASRPAACDLRSAVSIQQRSAICDPRPAICALRPAVCGPRPAICEIRTLGRCSHAALTAKSSLSAAAASGKRRSCEKCLCIFHSSLSFFHQPRQASTKARKIFCCSSDVYIISGCHWTARVKGWPPFGSMASMRPSSERAVTAVSGPTLFSAW